MIKLKQTRSQNQKRRLKQKQPLTTTTATICSTYLYSNEYMLLTLFSCKSRLQPSRIRLQKNYQQILLLKPTAHQVTNYKTLSPKVLINCWFRILKSPSNHRMQTKIKTSKYIHETMQKVMVLFTKNCAIIVALQYRLKCLNTSLPLLQCWYSYKTINI